MCFFSGPPTWSPESCTSPCKSSFLAELLSLAHMTKVSASTKRVRHTTNRTTGGGKCREYLFPTKLGTRVQGGTDLRLRNTARRLGRLGLADDVADTEAALLTELGCSELPELCASDDVYRRVRGEARRKIRSDALGCKVSVFVQPSIVTLSS